MRYVDPIKDRLGLVDFFGLAGDDNGVANLVGRDGGFADALLARGASWRTAGRFNWRAGRRLDDHDLSQLPQGALQHLLRRGGANVLAWIGEGVKVFLLLVRRRDNFWKHLSQCRDIGPQDKLIGD